MKVRIACTYICVFISIALPGQKNVDKGDKYFYQNQFKEAIKCYEADIKSRNKKVAERAMLGLADCYRISGEFELAEKAYQKLLKKFRKNPISYLNYGLALKSSAKYAEAKFQFEEYIKINPSDPMGPVYLVSCDSAQKWLDETMGKEVKNLQQINTNESEFSPVIVGDVVFFSSSREGSKSALISFDGGGNINRMDIYSVTLASLLDKEFHKKKITSIKNVNTPAHEGSPTFSEDGNEMYFTRTVKGKRDRKTNDILNTLQVFYSKKDSLGKWSSPVSAFDFNSAKYSISQPSLSKDGKTIYFMSDMPGGYGKTDIYYSTKNNKNNWTLPINAGKNVNTFGYELFPFISGDSILYFSSNAHPGMGQLDIFSARFTNGSWQHIENLKPPFNSIGNDFGICFDQSNSRGLFSSDRFNGAGSEDIYSFSKDYPLGINLMNDSIKIENTFLFDDIKYKLMVDDTVEIELGYRKNILVFKLESNKTYAILAKKNGLPLNKIEMTTARDSILDSYMFQIKTTTLPLRLNGTVTFNQPRAQTLDLIGDTENIIETISPTESGKFIFKAELVPELSYKVFSSGHKK